MINISAEKHSPTKRVFLSYLEDNSEIRNGWYNLISMDDNFVKFITHDGTTITIPISRFIKMKEKKE